MRAGGMSESSKWKKQKRSPRPPRHMVRSPFGQMDPTQSNTLSNNNLLGKRDTVIIIHSKSSMTLPQLSGLSKSLTLTLIKFCCCLFLSFKNPVWVKSMKDNTFFVNNGLILTLFSGKQIHNQSVMDLRFLT